MIDAEVPGDASANGVFAFDVAARRHHEVFGEQGLADFPVAIGATRTAEQLAVLLAGAELARPDEAAFPKAQPFLHGAALVDPALAGRAVIEDGEPLADQELAQAGRVALDFARADTPLLEARIRAKVIAADLLAGDQLAQLIARLDPAGPAIGILVDTELIDGGHIDAVEPIGDVAQLNRAAIPDDGGGGHTLAGREDDRQQRCNQKNS